MDEVHLQGGECMKSEDNYTVGAILCTMIHIFGGFSLIASASSELELTRPRYARLPTSYVW